MSPPPQRPPTLLIHTLIAELLLKAQELKSLERPSAKDYRSVLRFMENDGGQVYEEESGWIYDKEDLVTIRPGREHAWLDGFLERMLKVFRCKLLKVCFTVHVVLQSIRETRRKKLTAQYSSSLPARLKSLLHLPGKKSDINQETRVKTDDKAIHYYDRTRISTFVTMIITVAVLILLMIPVWLLYKASVDRTISKTPQIIVLVFGFTMIFSTAVSAFTKAKRHEIVVASAG